MAPRWLRASVCSDLSAYFQISPLYFLPIRWNFPDVAGNEEQDYDYELMLGRGWGVYDHACVEDGRGWPRGGEEWWITLTNYREKAVFAAPLSDR